MTKMCNETVTSRECRSNSSTVISTNSTSAPGSTERKGGVDGAKLINFGVPDEYVHARQKREVGLESFVEMGTFHRRYGQMGGGTV